MLPDDSTSLSNLLKDNGTIGLVQYDTKLGYFTIKIDDNLCDVLLPPCNIKGLPFLGQGSKVAPAYDENLWISSVTFFDRDDEATEQSALTTITTDADNNNIAIICPSSIEGTEMAITLYYQSGTIDIDQYKGDFWSHGYISPGDNYLMTMGENYVTEFMISQDIDLKAKNGYCQMVSSKCEFTLGDGSTHKLSTWTAQNLPLLIEYKEDNIANNILLDSEKIALSYNNEKNDDYNNSKILLNNDQINLQYNNTTDNYTTDINLKDSLTLSYIKDSINNSLTIAENQFAINAINNSLTITENQFKINTTNNSIILNEIKNEDEDKANIQLKSKTSIDLYIGNVEKVSLTGDNIKFNNKIIISTNSYGTTDPPTGAVAGQVYFKILSD